MIFGKDRWLLTLSGHSDPRFEWSVLGHRGPLPELALNGSVANDPFRTSGLISVCVRFCAVSYSPPDRKVLGFSRVAYPPHDLHMTGPSSQRMAVCLVKDDEGQ
jgi:hypothetical protein